MENQETTQKIEILEPPVKSLKEESIQSYDLQVSEEKSKSEYQSICIKKSSESLADETLFPKTPKSESMELIIGEGNDSVTDPKMEYLNFKGPKVAKTSQKRKVKSKPNFHVKMAIFHLDSMVFEKTIEGYKRTSKVFSQILNFLLIKEINQKLKFIEIVYDIEEEVKKEPKKVEKSISKTDLNMKIKEAGISEQNSEKSNFYFNLFLNMKSIFNSKYK